MSTRATILVVDDSEDVLTLIKATLSKEHDVRVAENAPTALKLVFEEPRPDLILLDVEMPDASGYDLCKTLKASPAVADIPVVFLTGRTETRDVVQGFQLGALDYLAKPVSPPVLAARIRNHLELIERRNKQDELLRSRGAELEQTRLELIRRLGRAMEYHESSAIGNRVIRLGHYARALAQAAGARTILTDMLMKAAPLHDIGKVGVPAAILRKAGQLTVPEREQMQRHPEIGAEIIGNHDDPLLKLARTLAFTHHERWDGTGYPTGAKGNDIPWAGRVMAIVDSWESMTVTQFHREPLPLDLAADQIAKGAGKQFDPSMVAAFKKALPEFRRIHATYADQLGDMLNLDFSAAPPPPPPKEKQDEQRAVQEQAAQALRAADAARAKALSDAQSRLKVEHDLAAAAQKDIVSQHAARKLAEEQAAREAELLAAAKKRATEESTATRFARDRAESDAKATDLAKQRQEAQEAAERAAKERAEAESAAAKAAKERAAAENSAQSAAVLRVQAEKEAEAAASLRAQAEAELEALRAAAAGGSEGVDELNARIVEDMAAAQAAREAARAAAAQTAPDIAGLEAKARTAAEQRAEAESALATLRATAVSSGERLAALQKQLTEDTAAAQAAREAARQAEASLADASAIEAQARQAAAERAEAEKAAQAASRAREDAEKALEEATRTKQSAEEVIARLRETSAGELQRLMAVRKRIEEETAAANAARAAAAEFANIDEVMSERMTLESRIEAAAGQRAAAEKALEGLRQAAERERQALEETKARLAGADLKALADQRAELKDSIANMSAEREALAQQGAAAAAQSQALADMERQKREAEDKAAAVARELEQVREKLEQQNAGAAAQAKALADFEGQKREAEQTAGAIARDLTQVRQDLAAAQQELSIVKGDLASTRQAMAAAPAADTTLPNAASQTIVALQDELRAANEALAQAKAAKPPPLVIGPAPAPIPRRAGALAGFLIGAAVAGAAVYVMLSELDKPQEPKAATVAEAKPVTVEQTGEPLKLRLDSAFEKISPKEPSR